MNFCSITPVRLLGCAFLIFMMLSCSAPAYSPSLGLGVDNVSHRNTRLGVSLENAPNALSARAEGPRTSRAISFRYERGLSDNAALRAKLFFAQNVSDDKPAYDGVGMGLGIEAIIRKPLSDRTDLLFVPRLQLVVGGLFGGAGNGGGIALLARRRLAPNLAIYGGAAAYFGGSEETISDNGGEFIIAGGRALGGHFGLSYNTASRTNFNLEVSPLSQHDNLFKRAVLVPVVQLTIAQEITGYSREERRTRREIRRMKRMR